MLRDIIKLVEIDTGIPASSTAGRDAIIALINRAMAELHDKTDLVYSIMEHVFSLDVTEDQVTLPWYVYRIRAVRAFDMQASIATESMAPRYHACSWDPVTLGRWRMKGFSPIARNIANSAPLIIRLADEETTPVSIKIVGATAQKSRIVETVTFEAGETEKSTVNGFIAGMSPNPIETIRKSRITSNDVTILDQDENIIAEIPAHLYDSRYQLVQIFDAHGESVQVTSDCEGVEILFKVAAVPMFNDDDSFLDNGYDGAIAARVAENYFARDIEKVGLVQMYRAKWMELIVDRERDFSNGQEKRLRMSDGRLLTGAIGRIPMRYIFPPYKR